MTPRLAAIFDFNGVVVNDCAYQAQAWIEFARRHGVALSEREFREHLSGRRNPESQEWLLKRVPNPSESERLTQEKERIYLDLYQDHIAPMRGLEEFLAELKVQKIPFALATSAPPEILGVVLGKAGLRFDTVVDASQVRRGKPDPEVFLTAAKRLGVAPGRCVVFEDAKNGIAAARAAGMKVVGVATTHTRAELEPLCDLVIEDFWTLAIGSLHDLFK